MFLHRTTPAWSLRALTPFISAVSPSSTGSTALPVPGHHSWPAASCSHLPLGRTRFPPALSQVSMLFPPFQPAQCHLLASSLISLRCRTARLREAGDSRPLKAALFCLRPEPLVEQLSVPLHPSAHICAPLGRAQISTSSEACSTTQPAWRVAALSQPSCTPAPCCATLLQVSIARASPGLRPARDVRRALMGFFCPHRAGGKKQRGSSPLLPNPCSRSEQSSAQRGSPALSLPASFPVKPPAPFQTGQELQSARGHAGLRERRALSPPVPCPEPCGAAARVVREPLVRCAGSSVPGLPCGDGGPAGPGYGAGS